MEKYWLNHWKTNDWVPYSCSSCLKWEPEKWYTHRIHCDKWLSMKPNEYCGDYSIDITKEPEEVIQFVRDFVEKNSSI